MKLNFDKHFDKTYCINLDRRTDRWDEFIGKYPESIDIVERFSAKDGQLFDLGYGKTYDCELAGSISHTQVIKNAIDLNLKNVLILEDDVEFSQDFNIQLNESMENMPSNWDIILFGGNHVISPTHVNKNIFKMVRTYAIQCYAINGKFLKSLYDYMCYNIGNVFCCQNKLQPSVAADFFMANIFPNINAYTVLPNITWQRKSYSDIQLEVRDYTFLK